MAEIVIIGGGLAGSAAAISLARAGRKVLLLEREAQPQHKVCGEFLSQEALHSLQSLGVDPGSLGARGIRAVRLADADRVSSSVLPFAAMSITRKRLDEALLQESERAGVVVSRGTRALQVRQENGNLDVTSASVVTGTQETIRAKTVFLATGKHDLAGRPRPVGVQGGMVGFKMYYALRPEQAAELAGHIELLLFRGGYAGLQLVEDGSANLGWIVAKSELQRLGGRWENVLAMMQRDCAHLAGRLNGAEALLSRPLAVSSIPYGYVRRASPRQDGVWALGDQAAVIPSFTGDGMAIALHSGQLAAAMYLAGETAQSYQSRLHEQLIKQVRIATAISRGLVWSPSRVVLTAAVRVWPRSLGLIARQTRIPARARLI